MATLSLQHVSKVYSGGLQAVRDFSLEVAEGEFVVLVGPSGCGKTTTLRMIAGLEDVTTGEIHIGERLVNHVPPAQRDVAMVFQDNALYPHMTVRQNMAFGLKMRRTPRHQIEQQVARVAQLLAIESLLDRRPRELSGGEQQRVALGRAIVRVPQVFLFDEPLSNLDAQLRAKLRTEISTLHRELSATMIYVTHDQIEAMTLGDRLVLMNEGRIQQVAAPLEVYRQPANRFVATFIGSPPMNLLAGDVRDGAFVLQNSNGQPMRVPVASALTTGPAILGFRPEDLRIGQQGIPLPAGQLQFAEHLGHEVHAHFEVAGRRCLARLDPTTTITSDQPTSLSIRPGGVHLFSGDEQGRRLE